MHPLTLSRRIIRYLQETESPRTLHDILKHTGMLETALIHIDLEIN
jgi:hypothetical protein